MIKDIAITRIVNMIHFKVIIALKNAGMSLKDIQIYLDQRNPQLFLELLNQQEAKLIEYINEMQQIHE